MGFNAEKEKKINGEDAAGEERPEKKKRYGWDNYNLVPKVS